MVEIEGMDDENRKFLSILLKLTHDENYQMALTSSPNIELKMDSWDIKLACNMIVFGDGRDVSDVIEQGLKEEYSDDPDPIVGYERAQALITVLNRVHTLANSAIAIGILKEHDTPENWIKWAKSKGYNMDHLNPASRIEEIQSALNRHPDNFPLRESWQKRMEMWQSPYLTVPMKAETVGGSGTGSQDEKITDWLNDPALTKLEKQHKAIKSRLKVYYYGEMEGFSTFYNTIAGKLIFPIQLDEGAHIVTLSPQESKILTACGRVKVLEVDNFAEYEDDGDSFELKEWHIKELPKAHEFTIADIVPETTGAPNTQPLLDDGAGKNVSEATNSWKKSAREIGESWMNEQRKEGKDPGVIDIAKYVEGEMSNRNLVGVRGKFLDFETIKREALTGITGKPANGKAPKKRK